MNKLVILILLLTAGFVYAQTADSANSTTQSEPRLATIQFGTETEIASLIQTLRNENADDLDDELIKLVETTRNTKILSGVFGFFGEREKPGLQARAIRAIEERDDESNETILSAIDYLGRIKAADAVPLLIELLETEERAFMNNAFRALGRASSSDKETAEEAADFLIDFYTNRDPGSENAREVIIALGATGSVSAVPTLVEIATDTNERVPLRIAALEALGTVGDESGLEAVLNSIGTNDPNVRAAAVAALGPFSGEEVDKAILDGFRDSFFRTRLAAAQASRKRRLAAAVPYLQFRAEHDEVPNVRDEAIRALGEIANDEAISVLDSLFSNRRNSDRIRILAAEMFMKTSGGKEINRLIVELEDAKQKNQTALYNGLLKALGETKVNIDSKDMEDITRRFLTSGGLMEKLYGLDMAVNNNLKSLEPEIKNLASDKNESIARKARRTAERLEIKIDEEEEKETE